MQNNIIFADQKNLSKISNLDCFKGCLQSAANVCKNNSSRYDIITQIINNLKYQINNNTNTKQKNFLYKVMEQTKLLYNNGNVDFVFQTILDSLNKNAQDKFKNGVRVKDDALLAKNKNDVLDIDSLQIWLLSQSIKLFITENDILNNEDPNNQLYVKDFILKNWTDYINALNMLFKRFINFCNLNKIDPQINFNQLVKILEKGFLNKNPFSMFLEICLEESDVLFDNAIDSDKYNYKWSDEFLDDNPDLKQVINSLYNKYPQLKDDILDDWILYLNEEKNLQFHDIWISRYELSKQQKYIKKTSKNNSDDAELSAADLTNKAESTNNDNSNNRENNGQKDSFWSKMLKNIGSKIEEKANQAMQDNLPVITKQLGVDSMIDKNTIAQVSSQIPSLSKSKSGAVSKSRSSSRANSVRLVNKNTSKKSQTSSKLDFTDLLNNGKKLP